MIPSHERFIEAIHEKKKVNVRFYSRADNGVVDRICAPLDYGPGDGTQDGLNRYWLWDYATDTGSSHVMGLLPQQIVDLRVLGELFDPAPLGAALPRWTIPREWGTSSPPGEPPSGATPAPSRV